MWMINGTKPERLKWKDFDYIRSFHKEIAFGAAAYPIFPKEYLTDKTNWYPDQNAEGEPYGCTNYSSAKLARILGISYATPQALEAVTHANASNGYSVLASIDAARTVLKWFNWRYTIQAKGKLDYFDAFRLAQVSGIPEQRAISAGSPWPASWETAVLSGNRIMPMPTADELKNMKNGGGGMSWHNYVFDGFSDQFPIAPGKLLYRADSWQGDKDPIYFPREVINVVFDFYGTIAVTATSAKPPSIATVSLPDWFWSLVNSWLGARY